MAGFAWATSAVTLASTVAALALPSMPGGHRPPAVGAVVGHLAAVIELLCIAAHVVGRLGELVGLGLACRVRLARRRRIDQLLGVGGRGALELVHTVGVIAEQIVNALVEFVRGRVDGVRLGDEPDAFHDIAFGGRHLAGGRVAGFLGAVQGLADGGPIAVQ